MLRHDEHEQVDRGDHERAGERELVHVRPWHPSGGETARHVGCQVQHPRDDRQRDADAQRRRAAPRNGCRASRRTRGAFAVAGVDAPAPAAGGAPAPAPTGAAGATEAAGATDAAAAAFASSAAFVAAAERRARSIAYAMNATAYTAIAEYTRMMEISSSVTVLPYVERPAAG